MTTDIPISEREKFYREVSEEYALRMWDYEWVVAVLLFGSVAKEEDEVTKTSDIDVMVVVDTEQAISKEGQWKEVRGTIHKIAMDVMEENEWVPLSPKTVELGDWDRKRYREFFDKVRSHGELLEGEITMSVEKYTVNQ